MLLSQRSSPLPYLVILHLPPLDPLCPSPETGLCNISRICGNALGISTDTQILNGCHTVPAHKPVFIFFPLPKATASYQTVVLTNSFLIDKIASESLKTSKKCKSFLKPPESTLGLELSNLSPLGGLDAHSLQSSPKGLSQLCHFLCVRGMFTKVSSMLQTVILILFSISSLFPTLHFLSFLCFLLVLVHMCSSYLQATCFWLPLSYLLSMCSG